MRVDMEASSVTQQTIDIFKRLRAEFGLNDVGIVLQSYLRRTYADAQELVKLPARIRICKGAYNEPPEVAFPDKKDTDENYVRVMQLLLASGIYHGIATHDPKMIDATIDFAQARRNSQRSLRVSNALWRPARFAAATRERRLQHESLCALRKTLVSLLHEPAGGTSGQHLVCFEEPAQRLSVHDGQSAIGFCGAFWARF